MKKIKPIHMVIAALILLTAIAAALHLTNRTQVSEGRIRVEWSGGATETYMARLRVGPVHGTVRNGKGEETAVDGEGTLLSAVLDELGIVEYEQVTVTADDSYSAVVTAEEIAQPDKVYLMIEDGGRARLVVFGDGNSKRNVSNVKLVSVS